MVGPREGKCRAFSWYKNVVPSPFPKPKTLNPKPTPVAILGAGSWGTAIALLLAPGGPVALWDRNAGHVDALARDRENRRYLPGHALPETVTPIAALPDALVGASLVVLAVPASALESVLYLALPALPPGAVLVLASKGIDPSTLELPSDTARRLLGAALAESNCVVAISGPNLAREVAARVPTAAVAASENPDAARFVAERFNQASFRTYVSDDLIGVEVGGAVKNVLAIAGGVSDGLGYGDNTKAALMTRGLGEMARLGAALGARRETFYGLAGVGDLMATAASRLSRNWRIGNALAEGRSLSEALSGLGQVAEGVDTARAVARLSEKHGLELPVCAAVDRVLRGEISPRDAVARLTENRATRPE